MFPLLAFKDLDFKRDKARFERVFILIALKKNKWKINATARAARISKWTLLRKMKRYGIII